MFSQETLVIPEFLKNPMDSITKKDFNQSLASFFYKLTQGEIDRKMLTPHNAALTESVLQELANYETKKDSAALSYKDKQLINVYPISDEQYFISVTYSGDKVISRPILTYIVNLVATKTDSKFTFSIPIDYLTRYWKTQTVGRITYHYRDTINTERAALFDKKNNEIARKLGLVPEKMDFYMTSNFQEISELLGLGYSLFSNGKYREGYGVDSRTIFAIMNNEDFSHDIFHYYSGKINKREHRNWITEEGIAYLWGNAYYTDKNGEMITHQSLVTELCKYLANTKNANLYELFKNNDKIFTHIAPEASVRSTISGIIAKEVALEKGSKGITLLINAGRKNSLESYLKVTDKLLGINKNNFNEEVENLIKKN